MAEKREGQYERKPEMPSKRLRRPAPDRGQHHESDPNKPNDEGQSRHDPQDRTPAEE